MVVGKGDVVVVMEERELVNIFTIDDVDCAFTVERGRVVKDVACSFGVVFVGYSCDVRGSVVCSTTVVSGVCGSFEVGTVLCIVWAALVVSGGRGDCVVVDIVLCISMTVGSKCVVVLS